MGRVEWEARDRHRAGTPTGKAGGLRKASPFPPHFWRFVSTCWAVAGTACPPAWLLAGAQLHMAFLPGQKSLPLAKPWETGSPCGRAGVPLRLPLHSSQPRGHQAVCRHRGERAASNWTRALPPGAPTWPSEAACPGAPPSSSGAVGGGARCAVHMLPATRSWVDDTSAALHSSR